MAFQGLSNRQRHRKDKSLKRDLKKRCTVYCLVDVLDGSQVYVGQTRTSLETRLWNHLKAAIKAQNRRQRLTPLQRYLLDCSTTGDLPLMTVLQENAQWDIAEAVWIDRLTSRGAKLFNIASRVPAG
ncbi:GIY-YIG nuclease family protein [Consotaella aegiceratis]|uniref:GIY-YIG nuclease family protein n=1 Tax=Consotaella aegiceratis TaxID=3097961 RepID=UPI002F4005C0